MRGEDIPRTIQDAPRIWPGLELWYVAFWDLSSERRSSFGSIGAIPWTAQIIWAKHWELDAEQTDDLLFLIGKMDEMYLDTKRKELEGD